MPGQYITTKLEDPNVERSEGKTRSVHEEKRIKQESNTNTIKKILLALLIIGGVIIIGWGGYYFYNMYVNQQANIVSEDGAFVKSDTTANKSLEDSILASGNLPLKSDTPVVTTPATIPPVQSTAANSSIPGNYKFIIESTDDKARALKRYNQLRSYGNRVLMQTKDSINFKIYYSIAATPADTLRLRDSLNRLFNANKPAARVIVEQ